VAVAHERLDRLGGVVGRVVPLGQDDERLDDRAALRVG
jgi:hypothetical protein